MPHVSEFRAKTETQAGGAGVKVCPYIEHLEKRREAQASKGRPTAVRAIAPTGDVYEYPSIAACVADGGFCYAQVRHALRGRVKRHVGWRFEALTPLRATPHESGHYPRTMKVIELRNRGLTNDEIAAALGMAKPCVARHASYGVSAGLCMTYHQTRRKLEGGITARQWRAINKAARAGVLLYRNV
ncbi:hypothetical protein [Aeromonas aquatica]|uniref:hypothetical protein n=1 Tax=Aeromonas aquatica TaxID=558964 RepID=UPI00051B4044